MKHDLISPSRRDFLRTSLLAASAVMTKPLFEVDSGEFVPPMDGQRRDELGRDSQPVAAVSRREWIDD